MTRPCMKATILFMREYLDVYSLCLCWVGSTLFLRGLLIVCVLTGLFLGDVRILLVFLNAILYDIIPSNL